MFIGKWNKSVILTYIGLFFSVIGMYLSFLGYLNYSLICLIFAGICDLFDGTVARMCKRTNEEKQFGIELDSLVDTVSFVVFPIVFYLGLGLNNIYMLLIYTFFGICGVARLAYFNISLEEVNKDKAVKYYKGLPVTSIALILPLAYLISFNITNEVAYILYYGAILLLVGLLYITNFKIKKPTLKVYPLFLLLAIAVTIILVII